MFEKEAKRSFEELDDRGIGDDWSIEEAYENGFSNGAEFGYNKANESHSPDEHIDKDRVVLGIIKHCNKIRYSLVQWNGKWWYQYKTYNAEVRLIAWYNIPELPKKSER